MFGSIILDVIIGLVFVYLFGSLASSGIMEIIARILKLRSKHLKRELKELLGGENLLCEIYNHHHIKKHHKGLLFTLWDKHPEYIPNHHFTTALLDTLVDINKQQHNYEQIKNEILKVKNIEIKKVLLKALDETRTELGKLPGALEKAQESIEQWFNNAMEKLTVWYKRQARKIIIVIGILLVTTLNLDTFMIIKTLYQNETLRDTIVVAAGKINLDQTENKSLEEILEKANQVNFPLGWHLGTNKSPNGLKDPQHAPSIKPLDLTAWLLKVFGLFITVMALSRAYPKRVRKWHNPKTTKS
jgi:hypothetical protein